MTLSRATGRPLASALAVPLIGGAGGPTAPGAPTIGTATAGNTTASVAFTAPGSNGGSPIIDYRVTSSPGGITATGAGSPITVTGLTNGQAYTFTVQARNAIGFGSASAASNSVTPAAPTFALTNRTIAASGQANSGINLGQNGVANDVVNGGGTVNISGQWVATGAFATIGNGYEAVATLLSGTNIQNIDGTAKPLSSGSTLFSVGAGGGSFSVIIRVAPGGATVAGPATFTVT